LPQCLVSRGRLAVTNSVPEDTTSPVAPVPADELIYGHARPIARWRWWIHLLLIAAFPLWIGTVSLLQPERTAPALSSSTRGLLWSSTMSLLFFGILFGGAWLASRASRDDLLLRWRNGFWPVPWGIGYSVALRIAVAIVVVALAVALVGLHIVSTSELQEIAQSRAPDVGTIVDVSSLRENPAYFWLMITLVSFVMAGLREELWRSAFIAGLRGLWPRRFATKRAQFVAVLIAAVLFGVGHVAQGPMAATIAGLLGVGLGAIMIGHRSIWPAVIAHGCFDATTFAVLPWAMEKLQALQQTLPH
jgi:membrane protease YdiL (CAAX protease family)